MLWLSDVAGSNTDLRALQRNNRESVQADVQRMREEIKGGKRAAVGSPEWVEDAGLFYDRDGVNVTSYEEAYNLNDLVNKEIQQSKDKAKYGEDFVDLMDREFPVQEWVVEGVFSEGLGLLIAAPKVGKSFLMLDTAISVASGQPVCGDLHTNQRKVLYLALEDGARRIQGRGKDLGKKVERGNLRLIYQLDQEEVYPTVESFIDENPNGLVIIDTLSEIMTDRKASASAYQHEKRFVSKYQELTKRRGNEGSSIIIVHHDRKSKSGDWMENTSGTNGLNGAADYIMNLSYNRGETVAQLRVGGRDAAEANVKLRKTDTGFWLHDETAVMGPTPEDVEDLGPRQQDILFALENSVEGMTPKELHEHLGWNSYSQVTNVLGTLKERNLVRRSAGYRWVVCV